MLSYPLAIVISHMRKGSIKSSYCMQCPRDFIITQTGQQPQFRFHSYSAALLVRRMPKN